MSRLQAVLRELTHSILIGVALGTFAKAKVMYNERQCKGFVEKEPRLEAA